MNGDDAAALIRTGGRTTCAARFVLTPDRWLDMAHALSRTTMPLLGLWADGVQVHALFMDGEASLIASVAVTDGRYQALSPMRAGAAAHERIIHDLWGIAAMGSHDDVPWLDQGRWPVTWPLRDRPPPASATPDGVEFTDDIALQQAGGVVLGYGPADGGFDSPFHLRLGMPGERITQVTTRMGYAHRGLCARMRGLAPAQAAQLAARIDATATMAHQLAFFRALATATGTAMDGISAAGVVLGEVERIATHLDCLMQAAERVGDVRFASLAGELLEYVRETCRAQYGRRLLLDRLLPGGAVPPHDLSPAAEMIRALQTGRAELRRLFHRPRGLATQGRDLGILSADHARRWGIMGCVGQASGIEYEPRPSLPGYRTHRVGDVAEGRGDVTARLAIRLHEIGLGVQRLSAAHETVMPASIPSFSDGTGEGIGHAEGPSGPVWHWVRLEGGRIAAWWCGDPSLARIQALPDILRGATYDDVGLIVTSLGLSAAGADL